MGWRWSFRRKSDSIAIIFVSFIGKVPSLMVIEGGCGPVVILGNLFLSGQLDYRMAIGGVLFLKS
jgi:hypothetical protein